jgi:hypothetical protein
MRHRHPAAREPQHYDIGATPILLEEAGQEPASIPSVAEQTIWHNLRPVRAEEQARLRCGSQYGMCIARL